jgi:phospholipid/cholesterol/gamma-HCH transport system substrate-binding protein
VIRRFVKVQLVIFVMLAMVLVAYVGVQFIGVSAFTKPFHVTAQFRDSGGIFTNAEVTYRGVGVGRVGKLTLRENGVDVTLNMDKGAEVPADTIASVFNKSPVGEQYVDLIPRSKGAPYLKDGSVIPPEDTRTPVQIQDVLLHLDQLSTSVDLDDLRVVVDELDKAFRDTGPALSRLIEDGNTLTVAFTDSLPDTIRLINASKIDLQTARDSADELTRFSRALQQLSTSLVEADPDVRRLFDNGIEAAKQVEGLIGENREAITVLLGNLITIGRIGVARIPGLRQTLISLPAATTVLPTAIFGNSLHNGLVTDEPQTAPPCVYDTARRQPYDAKPRAADLDAYCEDLATTQRGARYAPRPKGDDTAGPPSSGGPAGAAGAGGPAAPIFTPGSHRPGMTTYDPFTGLITAPDGQRYEMGYDGGQADILGEQSWRAILLALLPRR